MAHTNAAPPRPSVHDAYAGLAIKPPCIARRVLPVFPPPGYHMYDAYRNCFQYRPGAYRRLLEAAAREEHARLHGLPFAGGGAAAAAAAAPRTCCRCALDAAQLFASSGDVPRPPLPLSRCELHEVLLSLPPRWQVYPWRLCFDTAVDGVSLASLYRRLAVVEAQQSQVRTVALGIFFVHDRDDAGTVTAATSTNTSCGASPLSACSSAAHSYRMAARQPSARRYGAAAATRSHSVIGCFTPEVPSLHQRLANIYYGSTDTTVFRLDQLQPDSARGAWMASDMEQRGSSQRGSTAATTAAAAAAAAVQSFGYATFATADDVAAAAAPVPLPSRVTIEHPTCPRRRADEPAKRPPSLFTTAGANNGSSRSRSTTATAVATPSTVRVPAALSSPTSALARRRRPLVVPEAPLLERFTWCGRADNRRFIVCNPQFVAIGGGKSGAALYVDEALQYGTSSRWCETFNAPCLVGPRVAATADSPSSTATSPSSTATSPSSRGGGDGGGVGGGGGGGRGGRSSADNLSHREFAISRVVWFSIVEDKRTLRTMTNPDPLASETPHNCGCGRCGHTDEEEDVVTAGVAATARCAFAHRCEAPLPPPAPL
ncbi:hypothetical protein NESM_000206800 [Novymonas esmeraldas]|uniref:Oxidation resistance protein 1 n=1 Tax=Novymonas esmeraldas TaxID=1808958 RepID=A0AAW0F883_9TRYP